MTILQFDAQLARYRIRAARDTNRTEGSGEVLYQESVGRVHHATMSLQSGRNLHLTPTTSTKMTMKDVKAIHAQVQSQVVNNAMTARVSRRPVSMGELYDALFKHPNFDPSDHCFPSLSRDYFQRMTSADRAEIAWNYIEPPREVQTEVSDSTYSSSVSVGSSGEVSTPSYTHASPAVQSTSTPGEYPRQAIAASRILPTENGMDNSPLIAPGVEYRGMMYYGPAAAVLSYMAAQYAAIHSIMAPSTNTPQVLKKPSMCAPYMGSHTMVPASGPSYAPTMTLVPQVSLPQSSALYVNPSALPSPPSRIHIQFATSRHRMDERRTLSIGTAHRAIMAGINPFSGYRGEFTEDSIRNAQCPEDQNTSVHVEGFPVGTCERDILSVIKFAAVRNICIHPAAPGRFATVAADITFYKREPAEHCFDRGSEGAFTFQGRWLRFLWNKNKFRPADGEEMRQSRVLVIEGHESVISIEAVENLLNQKLVFKLVNRKTLREGDGNLVIWLEFCKLRGQARCAKKLLEEIIYKLDLDVVVSFGEDPCGPR